MTAITADDLRCSFTERELEVLLLLAQGKSNAEIAEVCGCKVGTVKTHLLVVFDILDVRNRVAAARCVWQAGLGL